MTKYNDVRKFHEEEVDEKIQLPTKDEVYGKRNNKKRKRDKDRKDRELDRWN